MLKYRLSSRLVLILLLPFILNINAQDKDQHEPTVLKSKKSLAQRGLEYAKANPKKAALIITTAIATTIALSYGFYKGKEYWDLYRIMKEKSLTEADAIPFLKALSKEDLEDFRKNVNRMNAAIKESIEKHKKDPTTSLIIEQGIAPINTKKNLEGPYLNSKTWNKYLIEFEKQ